MRPLVAWLRLHLHGGGLPQRHAKQFEYKPNAPDFHDGNRKTFKFPARPNYRIFCDDKYYLYLTLSAGICLFYLVYRVRMYLLDFFLKRSNENKSVKVKYFIINVNI